MSFFIGRTYLKSVGELIDRKDVRSVRRWCKSHHLLIYKDLSGEFVIENDLEIALEKPLILALKDKYGNAWIDYYKAYKNNELINILDFGNEVIREKTSYIPKGKLGTKILRNSA